MRGGSFCTRTNRHYRYRIPESVELAEITSEFIPLVCVIRILSTKQSVISLFLQQSTGKLGYLHDNKVVTKLNDIQTSLSRKLKSAVNARRDINLSFSIVHLWCHYTILIDENLRRHLIPIFN